MTVIGTMLNPGDEENKFTSMPFQTRWRNSPFQKVKSCAGQMMKSQSVAHTIQIVLAVSLRGRVRYQTRPQNEATALVIVHYAAQTAKQPHGTAMQTLFLLLGIFLVLLLLGL